MMILLNPGPSNTSKAVKDAQIVEDICPREHSFGRVVSDVCDMILEVGKVNRNSHFATLFGGSGTAAMEALITSCSGKDDDVLIIANGAYGERFQKIATTYNIKHTCVKIPSNENIDLNAVEAALKTSSFTHLFFVHHETTTGILNPLEELVALGKKYSCCVCVDTISSFGAVPIDLSALPVDHVISTSNKCLQGLPGLSFIISRNDALSLLEDKPKLTFYLNLHQQYKSLKGKGEFPFTPPVQTLYALHQALIETKQETVVSRYDRYCTLNDLLVSGMSKLGFRKYHSEEIIQSKILTTFYEPTNPLFSFDLFHDKLYDKGFTIYPGKIEASTFRLANMGDLDEEDMSSFLKAVNITLHELKIGIDDLYE